MGKRYYTRLRPVGLGHIPKVEWEWVEQPGIEAYRPINSELPVSARPYGIFTTDRPLTPEELYDYEISEDVRFVPGQTTCIETINGDPDTALRLSFQIKVF